MPYGYTRKGIWRIRIMPDKTIIFTVSEVPYPCFCVPILIRVVGSATGKGAHFRSPNEFVDHAIWLMEGMKMDGGNPVCGCKYCSKERSQTNVTRRRKGLSMIPRDEDNRERKPRRFKSPDRPIMAKDYRVYPTHGNPT